MLWELESLQKVSQIRPEMVESAMKELWNINPELHKTVVINAYINEKINLSKASELLSVSRFELEKELRENGIPIRSLSKEDVIAEVEAIREEQNSLGPVRATC